MKGLTSRLWTSAAQRCLLGAHAIKLILPLYPAGNAAQTSQQSNPISSGLPPDNVVTIETPATNQLQTIQNAPALKPRATNVSTLHGANLIFPEA
jgi:hypothetical protein